MTFAQRLRDLRARENLTQQELADNTHIARSTLAMYEYGKRRPDFEILDKLADYFDVSFDYILGRSDVDHGYPRHGDDAQVRRIAAYADKLLQAYKDASPDTQAAVRAILHVKEA
jgi:transcriptional regulator with XRE-family HTH domain